MDDNYKTYEEYDSENVQEEQVNDSEYYDGDDKRPKLLIIIGGIVLLIIVILVFTFACSKLNKKSNNNYLNNLRVTNGILSPEFEKNTLSYTVSSTGDMVTIACSAESSKAVTDGCNKNIYLTDECINHEIKVRAQDKSDRKYILNICKGDKEAPIVKSIDITPTGYTKDNVKVVITATSEKPLHEEAYSIDGGLTYQKSNVFIITENKTIEIKVRNKDNAQSVTLSKEINNIDKTIPKVSLYGSVDSGVETNSNVELTADVTPLVTLSGYKYEWYNGNNKIKGATSDKYTAKSSGTYKVKVITGSGNSATSSGYKVSIKSSNNNQSSNVKITSVTGNSENWTSKNITLKVNASSGNGLALNAYSFDGGKTYQKSNIKEFSSNQTVTIVVKDKKNYTTTYKVYITKIDKTTPSVTISGTKYVGETLTANVSPSSTSSGYRYEWYKDNTIISGATSKTYKPTIAGTYKVKVITGAGNNKISENIYVTNKINASVRITGDKSSGYSGTGSMTLTATVSNGSAKTYEWYDNNTRYNSCSTNKCTVSAVGNHSIKVRVITTTNYTTDFSNTYNFIIMSSSANSSIRIDAPISSGSPSNDSVYLTAIISNGKVSSESSYTWYKDGSVISKGVCTYLCRVSDSGTYRVEAITTSGERIQSSDFVFRKINVALNDPTGGNAVSAPVRLTALSNLKNYYSNVTYTWYRNGSVYSRCNNYYCDVYDSGNYTFEASISGFKSNRPPQVTINIKSQDIAPTISITSTVNGKSYTPTESNCAKSRISLSVSAKAYDSTIKSLSFQYTTADKNAGRWYSHPSDAWRTLNLNTNPATATIYFDYAHNYDGTQYIRIGMIPFRVRAIDTNGKETIKDYPIWMCIGT